MKYGLILAVVLLTGCAAGHWEQYSTDNQCPDCRGNGWDYDHEWSWLPWEGVKMVVRECETCQGHGNARPWRFVRDAERAARMTNVSLIAIGAICGLILHVLVNVAVASMNQPRGK